MIKTVDAAIDALGGNKAVAQIAGVGHSAVCNWRKAGKFPPHNFLKISTALDRLGHQLSPKLFQPITREARRTRAAAE